MTARDALALMERLADWQIARIDDLSYIPNPGRSAAPLGWVMASFYLGLTHLADRSADPRYAGIVLGHGAVHKWELGPRLYHADDHAIAQTWLWAHARTGDPATIAPLRARFDAILAAPSDASLTFESDPRVRTCQERWSWSDALFMAPPAWMGLAQATGDTRYRDFADREFWTSVDALYNRDQRLFFRDSRYAAPDRPYWSRGNGWAFAGLARVLQKLSQDDPRRARYEALFRDMAARLRDLQRDDGFWSSSLLEKETGARETSGTGFFVQGMAWGVKANLLDESWRANAEAGWRALESAIRPDGRLGWVQQIGATPAPVAPDDTQLYGVAAFLLAGAAIHDLRLSG